MIFFQQFFLDREKDLTVDLYMEGQRLFHVIRTPNHHTGNLITNLARLCGLETSEDERGLKGSGGKSPFIWTAATVACTFSVWAIRRSPIYIRTARWS